MGITCPAMQRPVCEGGGRFVRLSANICQLHRPNTIPIFCAAVCRDYRLRTFIGIAFKFLFLHRHQPVRDLLSGHHLCLSLVARKDDDLSRVGFFQPF